MRREGLAGRVSATMVTATVPLPPPHTAPTQTTPPFGPLQAEAEKMENKRKEKNERALLRFIWHPTPDQSAFACLGRKTLSRPNWNVTRKESGVTAKGVAVFNS